MADVPALLSSWDAVAANNSPNDNTNIGSGLADNFQQIQATTRVELATRGTIASAGTCDLSTVAAGSISVTGTTTITSFGTLSEGMRKLLTFTGALTLTHNATSLILPAGGSNITTAAGDTAMFESLGSGNWRCLFYSKASGLANAQSSTFAAGSASAPGLSVVGDSNTGVYSSGADSVDVTAGGARIAQLAAAAVSIAPTTAGADVSITAAANGETTIAGGDSNGSAPGGTLYLYGGDGASGDDAGNVTIEAGGGATTGGANGTVQLLGGAGALNTNGGNVSISSGVAGSGSSVAGEILLGSGGVGFMRYRRNGHAEVDDQIGTPTITSGGGTGSPAIVGTDTFFRVTLGTNPGATVRITFASAWNVKPGCFAISEGAVAIKNVAPATTLVDIVFDSAPASGSEFVVFCIGKTS